MIDINNQEYLSDILNQGNTISNTDLNNLCYIFLELLEASLCIQWQIQKEAEHQDNMHLRIYAEGFDNITKQCHHEFLELKKKNKWDNNIGEELQ